MTRCSPDRITNSDAKAMTGFSFNKLHNIANSGEVRTFKVGGLTLFDRRSFLLYLRDNYPNVLETVFYGEGGRNA